MSFSTTQQKTEVHGPGSRNDQQNQSHGDILARFIEAMRAAGITPHDVGEIIGDGELHRFRISGDKAGSKNGFYSLHLDGLPAGHFGSWKLGISQNWRAGTATPMTSEERAKIFRKIEADRNRRAYQEQQRHAEAARRAANLWVVAPPANSKHPYLVRKGITRGTARQHGDALMLPIAGFDSRLAGLQFVAPDGTKRMLAGTAKKGNFIPCSTAATAARILVCEGWATGRSLAEMEPGSVVLSSIDAGNLEPVAIAARRRWQDAELVICCDFDEIGRTKGQRAARAAGAKIMQPPEGLPPEISDWNDFEAMRRAGGEA